MEGEREREREEGDLESEGASGVEEGEGVEGEKGRRTARVLAQLPSKAVRLSYTDVLPQLISSLASPNPQSCLKRTTYLSRLPV